MRILAFVLLCWFVGPVFVCCAGGWDGCYISSPADPAGLESDDLTCVV